VGTFAQRGLAASSLRPCGSLVPITRDAAISCPLFILDKILGYFHCSRFPKGSLVVARLVTCLPLCSSMLSSTPGCRLRARLYRTHRMACACSERIGTFPISNLLGAMCQIQGYTLHLAALAYLPFRPMPSVITLLSGRLTLLRRAYVLNHFPLGRQPLPGYPELVSASNKTCAEFISVSNPYETLKRVQGDKKELRHSLLAGGDGGEGEKSMRAVSSFRGVVSSSRRKSRKKIRRYQLSGI